MIEANVEWTLEGPDDSITFNDGGVWVLTEKPRTTVDDRRDTYDYPLDDGGYVGDAYAGMRAWGLKGMLVATSHSERNIELQRLNALLNSLRRADGLLKWQPNGFPAVQSTVRRMGSVDYSGGASLHVPVAFGLLSGDPRVYSQTENSDVVTPTTSTIGSNLLPAGMSGLETTTDTWSYGGAGARSTDYAHAGSYSGKLYTSGGSTGTMYGTKTLTSGTLYGVTGKGYYRATGGTARFVIYPYNTSTSTMGTAIPGAWMPLTNTTWTDFSTTFTMPAGYDLVYVYVEFKGNGGTTNPNDYWGYFDTFSVHTVTNTATATVANDGDAVTRPVYLITGPVTDPEVSNVTSSEVLPLDTTVAALQTLTVDSLNREIYTGPSVTSGTNVYSAKAAVDPFPLAYPGSNTITMEGSGTTGATELEVVWRDAWMP